jgi:hypothetical protein
MTDAWKQIVPHLLSWCPPDGVRFAFRADNRTDTVVIRMALEAATVDAEIKPGTREETFAGLDLTAAECVKRARAHHACRATGGCDHCRIVLAVDRAALLFEGYVAGMALTAAAAARKEAG